MRSSLRGRLFGYIVLGILISTALTVAVAAILVHQRTNVQAQRTLDRQSDALAAALAPDGSRVRVYTIAPRGLGGVRPVPAARARSILAAVPATGDHSGRLVVAGSNLLYAERQGMAGQVVLVRSAKLGPRDTQPFLVSLILAGAGGALLAALLAFTLARRLAAPLAQLAQASRSVVGTEERVRVSVPKDAPEELAVLGDAFNQMAHDLVEARSAQRSFLLSVSHELKTPLTAIQGYAEGLQDDAVDAHSAAEVIALETARLERLIGDLLDLARLDQHSFNVSREAVQLGQVADQLIARFAAQAGELGVTLAVERAEGPPALADPDRVLQVASNLVENALRATPTAGTVTISVCGTTLGVRDTGPGLAPEDVARAFERFYLHEKLKSADRSGSGLGLAIVKQLTEAMGGSALVHSELGRGSEFTIALPPATAQFALAATPG